MNIGIAMTFPDGYSGGRLHAFLLGAELAAQGHAVTFVCNQEPAFLDKLPPVPGRELVRYSRLRFDLLRPPRAPHVDLWVVVQERSLNGRFFAPVFEHARREQVPILLLTFETANWQEAVLEGFVRGAADALVEVPARLGAQCLSLSHEGRTWARAQFPYVPEDDFHVLYPPITASYYPEPHDRDPRLILAVTRRASPHKGYETILRLLTRRLQGWRVVLVDGYGPSYEADNYISGKRRRDQLDISIRANVTDEEKYRLIKSARVLLYPSLFEGFGLPPGEAAYWGTPVVCYDLPVLREVYGDSLRYVHERTPEAFERALWDELDAAPDYTPSAEARRIGDYARWRDDVRRMLHDVMTRARPPAPLTRSTMATPAHAVIVDQIGNWHKDDTAASAGLALPACEVIAFDRDLFTQRRIDRAAQFIQPVETLLPPGNAAESLRTRLLNACESSTSEWVFLTEDLLVCPRETIDAACESAARAGAVAAAVPVQVQYQADGPRHYRTQQGDLLAACGVFSRGFLLEALSETSVPGCRTQPVVDVSFLVLSRGGRIVAAPGCADRLPPLNLQFEFDLLPGGRGTWHAAYRDAMHLTGLVDPLPCLSPGDDGELALLTQFRAACAELAVDVTDRTLRRSTLREMLDLLFRLDRPWREAVDLRAPGRTVFRIDGAYLRFGRCFLTGRHQQMFLDCIVKALADGPPAEEGPREYRRCIREWRGRTEELLVVD